MSFCLILRSINDLKFNTSILKTGNFAVLQYAGNSVAKTEFCGMV